MKLQILSSNNIHNEYPLTVVVVRLDSDQTWKLYIDLCGYQDQIE